MKIICIGRNYIKHAKELNNPIPSEPIFFIKPESAILQNNAPFIYPKFSNNIHYELEIVVKISKLAKKISQASAQDYFNELGLGIDFTARDIQEKLKQKGHPWERAKAFDGSAPISSFINKKKFPNLNAINFHLDISNKTVQQGNSKNMIFSINKLITDASQFFTLCPGDLIFTGTPEGVGPIQVGDKLTGYLENKLMLDFSVK